MKEKKSKKNMTMLPCATCGNDLVLHRNRLLKCPYCNHYNRWDGIQVIDDTNK